VLSLEAAGASVSVVPVDVADHAAMAALIEGVERSQAPLRGIIHAAGDLRQCPVDQLDRAILQAMLRPKIGGALVLHELTQKLDLDFFVLFSSTAAVWGAAGWAHYGAGNAALDALAHVRRRQGLPGLSVNWGTWATMRVFSPEERAQVERFGLRPMQTEEALAALGAVLGGAAPQRVVAAVDWGKLRSAFEARRPLPLLRELDTQIPKSHVKPRAARPGKDLLLEQLASAAPAERLAILAEHVAGHVGKALGLDARAVDHNRGFFDMGMDSLTSAELRRSLEARLGHALPATLVFNYPTVAALAAHLAAGILPLLGLPVEATAETVPFATSSAEWRADEAVSDEADARPSEGDLLARLRSKLQKLR
jgi:myxalamid-type polyketide synthase MxaE and MxaD